MHVTGESDMAILNLFYAIILTFIFPESARSTYWYMYILEFIKNKYTHIFVRKYMFLLIRITKQYWGEKHSTNNKGRRGIELHYTV